MNWLPKDKEKRKQLFLAVIITVGVVVLIIFGLIDPQIKGIADTKEKIKAAQDKLQTIHDAIQKANEITLQLADVTSTLSHAEEDMASGDVLYWTIGTVNNSKAGFKVEIPTVGQPVKSDVDLLGHFPYKQAKFTVNGTAYYHDFGKFIAAFENKYPHIRVVNLSLEPTSEAGANGEKLAFSMELIALIKSDEP
jgi:Tfp pilus assembly protein PilO